ncbi:MAG TPA: BamA/TamA family outer membrane protein, partial [Gemmatimonadaceae bacterium]|nr:BamA/TamA family outer membrane protein [Gemmatimonadaceae bacterium]
PTAVIDGDLLVVGGDVDGRNTARVSGSIRIYHQSLRYREDGARIVATAPDTGAEGSWWQRLEHRREETVTEALRVVQAGPYNRVEGLPIELGPALQRTTPWGGFQISTAAIVRTGSFNSSRGDVGNDLRGEVRLGQARGVALGARAFDVVEPVERWELTDLEVALASFLARRDYRDYYTRHGGGGYATLYGFGDVTLTGSFGQERWSSRALRDPFTLFDDDRPWRPNPTMDDDLLHIASATLKLDTRTDPDDPWSGWLLNANVEHGEGGVSGFGLSSDTTRVFDGALDGSTSYTRGMVDVRRYNRLGPDAQLNLRLVAGGWLGGDELPLEKRFSVDGPGVLPGFDFRSPRVGPDVGTCNETVFIPGRPAECDRMMLAQVEYRGDLDLNFTSNWENWPRHFHSAHGDIAWVVFADAGRGWKIGAPGDGIHYDSDAIPPLSTFRTDVGLGLDVGGIGIYAAKSASTPSEPLNFFVRLRHRF